MRAVGVVPPLVVYCDQARPLTFDAASVSLTGAWSDQGSLFYFRQDGATVWGESLFGLGRLASLSTDLASFRSLVFHGTVGPGSTVHLDWGDVGAVNPGDERAFVPPLHRGSIVLLLQAGVDGNAELISVSESGAAFMGPGSSTSLVFSPCVPASKP